MLACPPNGTRQAPIKFSTHPGILHSSARNAPECFPLRILNNLSHFSVSHTLFTCPWIPC